jgi:hypothetical protein
VESFKATGRVPAALLAVSLIPLLTLVIPPKMNETWLSPSELTTTRMHRNSRQLSPKKQNEKIVF